MRDVLDKNDVDDNNTADLYQQVLWRLFIRFGQYKDKPFGKVESAKPMKPKSAEPCDEREAEQMSGVEKRMLDSVSKTMKRKAQLLLDHIKNNPGQTFTGMNKNWYIKGRQWKKQTWQIW